MGRKNLGGSRSTLKANHTSEEYNDTLENVFDTAMANLDTKHKKKSQSRRKVPNLLSLCFKSAADDVVDTSAAPAPSSPAYGAAMRSPSRKQETALATAADDQQPEDADKENASTTPDPEDTFFIMKDGTTGESGHYNAKQRGTVRSTLRRVAYSIQKSIASTGSGRVATNRHAGSDFYDVH